MMNIFRQEAQGKSYFEKQTVTPGIYLHDNNIALVEASMFKDMHIKFCLLSFFDFVFYWSTLVF